MLTMKTGRDSFLSYLLVLLPSCFSWSSCPSNHVLFGRDRSYFLWEKKKGR
jgi:hypothetical protein